MAHLILNEIVGQDVAFRPSTIAGALAWSWPTRAYRPIRFRGAPSARRWTQTFSSSPEWCRWRYC